MWICCQIGGREHYAVPRALTNSGETVLLFTDIWVAERSFLRLIPSRRLHDRYHDRLRSIVCHHFSLESILRDSSARMISAKKYWGKTIKKNEWFQTRVIRNLRNIADAEKVIVFAYSYAARRIFDYAKERGWQMILGQIDPGKREEDIVRAERERYPQLHSQWAPAPAQYWASWHKECELADSILVNSQWSAEALALEGIPLTKIKVVPLAYDVDSTPKGFAKSYPESFSKERPLRVLFLGQVVVRKGIGALLEAADCLQAKPVEFVVVGPIGVEIPTRYKAHSAIKWIGAVPRSEVGKWYREADVFLFPTLSDGFGLTQIEAAAYGLPIIASTRCGAVVQHGVNGLLLKEVSSKSLTDAISLLLDDPSLLRRLSNRPTSEMFSLETLGQSLLHLQGELLEKRNRSIAPIPATKPTSVL